ncbi:MAG: hypothetical protein ABJC87_13510, partial [Roseobacter sp.]
MDDDFVKKHGFMRKPRTSLDRLMQSFDFPSPNVVLYVYNRRAGHNTPLELQIWGRVVKTINNVNIGQTSTPMKKYRLWK